MSGLFEIGLSGLRASQIALKTTGQNIDNLNTEGYSRQRVNVSATQLSTIGNISPGDGVSINSVERIFDQFITKELNTNTSAFNRYNMSATQGGVIDKLLSNNDTNLTNSLQSFYSTLQAVNANPTDMTARVSFLNTATQLAADFNNVYDSLNSKINDINLQVNDMVSNINAITGEIARINQQLAATANPSNTLLDQRDQAVKKLSEYVSVNSVTQSDNTINVFTATGETLVSGVNQMALSVQNSASNPRFKNIVLQVGGSTRDITDVISGGQMQGLVDYRKNILEPTIRNVDRLALVFSADMNTQNQNGMDLYNQLGGTLFNDVNDSTAASNRVVANNNNVGSATMAVTISTPSSIKNDDYTLEFSSATQYTLVNNISGALVKSGTLGSLPASITADGYSIDITATSNITAGDKFLISPTRDAANNMAIQITDPKLLAIASPIKAQTVLTNTGTGVIGDPTISNISNTAFATSKALTPPIRIVFTSTTAYDIINATDGSTIKSGMTFVPNTTNNVFPTAGSGSVDYGYRVTLSGAPASGDVFTVSYNTDGFGDNSNGELMAATQTSKNVAGSTLSYQEDYTQLVSTIASRVQQTTALQTSYKNMVDQLTQRRESVSGVNLDEETANLLLYQQSYQACSKIIAAGNAIFDALMSALG